MLLMLLLMLLMLKMLMLMLMSFFADDYYVCSSLAGLLLRLWGTEGSRAAAGGNGGKS